MYLGAEIIMGKILTTWAGLQGVEADENEKAYWTMSTQQHLYPATRSPWKSLALSHPLLEALKLALLAGVRTDRMGQIGAHQSPA